MRKIEPEKCPQCTLRPEAVYSKKWIGNATCAEGKLTLLIGIPGYVIVETYYQCQKQDFFSLTKNGCYRKWNRWVRDYYRNREAIRKGCNHAE